MKADWPWLLNITVTAAIESSITIAGAGPIAQLGVGPVSQSKKGQVVQDPDDRSLEGIAAVTDPALLWGVWWGQEAAQRLSMPHLCILPGYGMAGCQRCPASVIWWVLCKQALIARDTPVSISWQALCRCTQALHLFSLCLLHPSPPMFAPAS